MSITVVCPECSARLKAPDHLAGKTVSCSQCRAVLSIPLPELEELTPVRLPPSVRQESHEEEDRPRKRKQFVCPFCQSEGPPETVSKVSTAGWVIFCVLLVCCFPLCFIGILIKEETRKCRTCGSKLG